MTTTKTTNGPRIETEEIIETTTHCRVRERCRYFSPTFWKSWETCAIGNAKKKNLGFSLERCQIILREAIGYLAEAG